MEMQAADTVDYDRFVPAIHAGIKGTLQTDEGYVHAGWSFNIQARQEKQESVQSQFRQKEQAHVYPSSAPESPFTGSEYNDYFDRLSGMDWETDIHEVGTLVYDMIREVQQTLAYADSNCSEESMGLIQDIELELASVENLANSLTRF